MDRERFDNLTRFWSSSASRRALIARTSSGLLAMAPVVRDDEEAAAKRKRCKRPERPTRQPTCAESCGPSCLLCFNRPDSELLCGDGWQIFCVECASDNDCVGTEQPHCIVDRTSRATGERRRWTEGAGCPQYAVGICTRVLGCNDI